MTSVIKISTTNDFDSKECIVPITIENSDVKIHQRSTRAKGDKETEKSHEQAS